MQKGKKSQMNFYEMNFQSKIDTKTITRLLQIRHLFKEAEKSRGEPIITKLINEIVNSENS